MIKIVINTCFGGFGLSEEAEAEYKERMGIIDTHWYYWDLPRDCPVLVSMVEAGKVDGDYAELKVVEIPDDVKWHIHEYDGIEHVAEDHRTWS